jgi:osmotically-inducible protein OsmY
MDDKTLRQLVVDELDFEPKIDAAHIGVAVDHGVVTLTGHVSNYAEKIAAEEAVRRVKGVKAIAEEIEIRFPSSFPGTSDDEIAKQAVAMLGWHTSLPKDRIQVKVQQGWITLSGEVDWYYQKEAAAETVRRLNGVRGVNNLVIIKSRVLPSDVRQRIEQALKRNAEVEANSISVTVADGNVILEGKVKAWHERQIAEQAAWAVPGVRAVQDKLRLA